MVRLRVLPRKLSSVEKRSILNFTAMQRFQIAMVKGCLEINDSVTTFGWAARAGNIGIQYATIKHSVCIRNLAANTRLHLALVPLILEESNGRDSDDVLHALSINPVVLTNLNALKSVLEKMRDRGMESQVPEVLRRLFYQYPFGTDGSMSIEIFLMVFSYMETHHQDEIYLLEIANHMATERHDDLNAWVKTHMPDFAGLPLSWVLKSYYDLYL